MNTPAALRLQPYTPALAQAYAQGRLAEHLGLPALPEGWPTFPKGMAPEWAKECGADGLHWGSLLFLRADGGALLGNGGFMGEPAQGSVELGYEIAPAHRGQGWAQAAVHALLAQAWSHPGVQSVLAHTLAQPNPSTGVLRACGFVQEAELPDDEHGALWRWRRVRGLAP